MGSAVLTFCATYAVAACPNAPAIHGHYVPLLVRSAEPPRNGLGCLACRWILVPIMVVWSSWASIPFISGAVPLNRRALAIYPMVLLYTALGWLALIT